MRLASLPVGGHAAPMTKWGQPAPINFLIGERRWLSRPAPQDFAECYAFPMSPTGNGVKDPLAHIGREIRRRRRNLGLSQAALAAKAGIHANVVGRTERGIHNPSVMTLYAIASALNTSIVQLMRDNAAMP